MIKRRIETQLTIHCDHQGCWKMLGADFDDRMPEITPEMLIEKYGWDEKGGYHYCDIHKEGAIKPFSQNLFRSEE